MSLADIVNVSISANTKTVSRFGFGIALLLACTVPAGWGVNRVRTFGSLEEMTDLGFTVDDPAYKMAAKLKSQSPSPTKWKIGKRLNKPTKLVKLTIADATVGKLYEFTVNGSLISYTVPGAATTTSVATALAALIDALATVSATSAVAVITITAAAGVIFDVSGWYECGMLLKDDTVDPGITADLAACQAADSDWYGLGVDSMGELEGAAAALWVEANKKIFPLETADSECLDPADTDCILSTLKTSAYARTGGFVSTAALMHYTGVALLGKMLPTDPGEATWKFKTLAGVAASKMTEGEKAAVAAKKGNTYTDVAGANIVEEGWTASGEFFDTTWFIDWLESEIKVRVFAQLANAAKIPYTDAGVLTIVSTVKGTLADGIAAGGLAADPAPVVNAPAVSTIDASIRATRHYPDMTFEATLAGAIHKLTVKGVLSV